MPPVRRYPAVSAPETMPVLPDTPALANKVSKLPYSTLPRACRPLVGAAVTTLPPPPIAWLPHGTELGPRNISTRSIDPDNRLAKSNPPPGDDGSLTRTPSINVSVCSPSAPRIRTALNPPIPPLRVTVTPGVVNVVTIAPTSGLQARGNVEYGSFDTLFANAGVSGNTGIVSGALTAGYLRTGGISSAASGTEPDGYRQYGAPARVGVAISDAVSLDLRGYYADRRIERDGFASSPPFLQVDDGEYAKPRAAN